MLWRHRGPMESATSWTRHNLVACRCWQASAWQTNAMQEVATFLPSQRKFANFGAHRDHLSTSLLEIAKPLFLSLWKSEGISTFSERRLQVLSYLLLQLASNGRKRAFRRRALRRPHPARREGVTCGDTDMDWPRVGAVLHTTGLWGRSYLGVGRRLLPAETRQRALSKRRHGFTRGKPYLGRIHIWDYPEGESGPYGHLAQYRGWPETRAS